MVKKYSKEEAKERKNAAQTAKRRALRDAGFTRDEARNIKKAVTEKPTLLDAITNVVTKVIDAPFKVLDTLGAAITGKPTKQAPAKRSKPNIEPRGYTAPGQKRVHDFESYVRAHPGVTVRQLIRDYRAQGGSIGNVRGQQLYREVHGIAKNPEKVHKIKYWSLEDYPTYGGERWKQYKKARFIYLVQFEVEREGFAEGETDFLHVVSPTKMSFEEIRLETEAIWNQSNGAEGVGEMYRGIRIIPESIELIRAVDLNL